MVHRGILVSIVALMLLACGDGDLPEPGPALEVHPELRGERVLAFSLWPWNDDDGPYQRVELWLDPEGDGELGTDAVLLLRYLDDRGDASDPLLSWSAGYLDLYGQQRLDAALAAVDLDDLERPSDCGFVDPPILVELTLDGQGYDYIGACPPAGLEALADFYQDLVATGIDCPADPGAWWSDPVAMVQLACATVDE